MSRAQLTSTVEQNTGGAVAPFVAGKNFIANGGFDIWQRGTSGFTTSGYMADNWYSVTAGTTTFSQDTDVPSGVPVQYSMKWVTSASSSFGQYIVSLEQAVVKPLRGQTLTLSIWLKTASYGSGNLILRANYSNSSDARTNQTTTVGSDTIITGTTPTSWTKLTKTFTMPSDAVGISLLLIPDTAQGSGVTVKATAMQLELGSVPTPFSRAGGTLQGELALCQRYYYRQTAQTAYSLFGSGIAYSTTAINGYVKFPVTMRTAPYGALDTSSNLGVYDGANLISATFALNTLNTLDIGSVVATSSGLTQWRPYHFISNNSTSSYIGFSAEL